MNFLKSEVFLSVYLGAAFGLMFSLFSGSAILFVPYSVAMFLWTMFSYFVVKVLNFVDIYIKVKFGGI